MIVTDRLVSSFDDIMHYSFTANFEDQLDRIANGELNWKEVLNSYYLTGSFVKGDGKGHAEPTTINLDITTSENQDAIKAEVADIETDNNPKRGIGGGMNFCASKVKTEFINFLQADIYVAKDWDLELSKQKC